MQIAIASVCTGSQPPYDAGSPAKAPEAIVASQRASSRFVPTGHG